MNTNQTLEAIIQARSTQRKFSRTHIPTRETLEQVIEMGVYAPFPALGTNRRDNPRKFIVIQKGTPAWDELKSTMTAFSKKLYKLTQQQTLLRLLNRLPPKSRRVSNTTIEQSEIYARMLAESRGDFAHFDTAPFWVIIAERRHMPAVMAKLNRQSLGHCFQNIWLKATELGMIMQPISIISQFQSNQRIRQMLGLAQGNWEMDSFLVGYPEKGLKPLKRVYNLDRDIIWHLHADERRKS